MCLLRSSRWYEEEGVRTRARECYRSLMDLFEGATTFESE